MFSIFKNLFGTANTPNIEELMQQGAYLVDVRTPAEFSQGNVKGSVNIPLDKIASSTNKLKGKQNIIVFCRSGSRSAQAKSILEKNGFTNVSNGGTWQNVSRFVAQKK